MINNKLGSSADVLIKSLLEKVSSSQNQVDNAMEAVKSAAERIEEMRGLLRRSYEIILSLDKPCLTLKHIKVQMYSIEVGLSRELKKLKSDLEEELGEEPQKKGVLKNGS